MPCHSRSTLAIIQQGLPLSVLFDNTSFSLSETQSHTEDPWDSNRQGEYEEHGHDRKRKDPLERNNLGEELIDPKSYIERVSWFAYYLYWFLLRTCGEIAELETDGIVLVGHQEKASKSQDTPDHDVGKDPGRQVMCMDHHSTVPEDGHKRERQRCRYHRNVDEADTFRVAEI